MAEKNIGVQKFVWAFVGVILAVAFISTLATQTNQVTTKTTVTNESYALDTLGCVVSAGGGQVNQSGTYPSIAACNITVTNAPTGWKSEDCPLTSVVVHNETGVDGTFTLDTDYYLFADTGIIQMLNGSALTRSGNANTTTIDYTYCGSGYVNSAWGRSILGVNVGLYGIAILILVVALVYLYLKNKDD